MFIFKGEECAGSTHPISLKDVIFCSFLGGREVGGWVPTSFFCEKFSLFAHFLVRGGWLPMRAEIDAQLILLRPLIQSIKFYTRNMYQYPESFRRTRKMPMPGDTNFEYEMLNFE